MARDDTHAPGEACCLTCGQFAGREPPARQAPPLRLRPDEAVIRIREGRAGAWREQRLAGAEVIFGRTSRSAQVVLDHSSISRQQFRLRLVDDGVEVEDLRSACGTYVDGRQIQRALLPEGSTISAGDFEIRVERA